MLTEFLHGLNYYKHKLYRRLKRTRGRIRYLFSSPEPDELQRLEPIFLLSTGRTGTTFLAKLFSRAEGVLGYHEPQPDFSDLGVNFARGRTEWDRARRDLAANRSWIIRKLRQESQNQYFEANHFLFSLPEVLKSIFPRARFIHVVRDGRDFLRSGYSKGYYATDDMYDRPRAIDFPDDPFHDNWSKFNRFEKIAWYWQFKDGCIENSLEELEPTVKIYFEDIFSIEDDYPGMRKMINFANVDIEGWRQLMNDKERSTSEYAIRPWRAWKQERREKFKKIAGDHLKHNSYSWDD